MLGSDRYKGVERQHCRYNRYMSEDTQIANPQLRDGATMRGADVESPRKSCKSISSLFRIADKCRDMGTNQGLEKNGTYSRASGRRPGLSSTPVCQDGMRTLGENRHESMQD